MSRVVLIAIDASAQAEAAFDWYMSHIHQADNVIVVLHCLDLSAITMQDDDASASRLWDKHRGQYKEIESKYRWKLNDSSLPGKIRTESGKPGEVVIKVANEEKAGIIVIGSRGLNRLQRTMSESVSDYVLHHANCAVIICRQKEETTTSDKSK